MGDSKWPAPSLRVSNIEQLEKEVQHSDEIEAMVLGYYASGADSELTLKDNLLSYKRWQLLPRMLRDVSNVDMSTNVLGSKLSMPLMVAPMAMQQMAHEDGELAVSRACKDAGTTMILSTMGNYSIKQVAQAAGAQHLWFQLYVFKNRETVKALVQEAERLGFRALVVTADAPMLGNREADARNNFHLPEGLSLGNATYTAASKARTGGEQHGKAGDTSKEGNHGESRGSGIASVFLKDIDASLTWELIGFLRSITRLPILVKGILHPEDARMAVEYGVDGIVVSNHGGRQLDTVPAPIDVLPAIHAAVGGRVPLLLDGGVRRGTDVLKALALGADAVCIGRPILYALARAGQAGVQEALELLRWEIKLGLALAGCANLRQLTPACVRHISDMPMRSAL